MNMEIEFTSMLATAQNAAKATSIERVLAMAGNLAGIDPAVVDNIDFDMALDIYSSLLSNDPRMIRSPDQLAAIREQRQQQQAAQQQAEMAEKLAAGAQDAVRNAGRWWPERVANDDGWRWVVSYNASERKDVVARRKTRRRNVLPIATLSAP